MIDFIDELLEGRQISGVLDMPEAEDVGIIDLTPYKVRDVNNYYFREHPTSLNPETPKFKKYWADFGVKAIEGEWIYDVDTWVYMGAKSFFYHNYLTIEDKKRNVIHPDYRDLDRILARYVECADGFSGFEGDDKYTCHELVKKSQKKNLEDFELKRISKFCYIPGTQEFKEYVHPWTYLMRTYLIDDNRGRPLGKALWENQPKNMCILGGRASGKSSYMFVADFLHEWFFGGVKRKEQSKETQNRSNFGMASTDSANLNRSAALIASTMTRLPGSYRYQGKGNIPRYNGPFYKNYTSRWRVGNEIKHTNKDKNGNVTHIGSNVQIRVVTPDKSKIFAGDRFRRIYFEEAGFIEKMIEIHSNQVDTLSLHDERVGSEVLLGTSGEIKSFRQINSIFNKPKAYEVQDIPNYWGASGTNIGLFLPAYYTKRDYSNENGDVDLVRSFQAVVDKRAETRKDASSMAYDKLVMFHPLEPKEMMRPSGDSVLPKQEAQDALTNLEINQDFEKRAMVGVLKYNNTYPNGVKFEIDIEKELRPILTFDTNNITDTRGAFIQYEIPTPKAPPGLYWVLYDPAAQSGEGTSFHSVLIYKYSFVGNENTLEDTIVGEWLGRLPTLELNWSEVIKIAKYFNAKIFPEYNTPGFLDWCKDRKYMGLLQPENINLKRELNPKATVSAWKKGFRMDTRAKGWALNQLRDWLLEVIEYDSDGVPVKRVIDTIYSKRLLEEIVNYDPNTGNYDHISSALGLMMLQNALRNLTPPEVKDPYGMDSYLYPARDVIESVTPYTKKVKSRLNNSKLLGF
jgi:hypothetical protein